jgi:hypothetical protein
LVMDATDMEGGQACALPAPDDGGGGGVHAGLRLGAEAPASCGHLELGGGLRNWWGRGFFIRIGGVTI